MSQKGNRRKEVWRESEALVKLISYKNMQLFKNKIFKKSMPKYFKYTIKK